MEACWTLSPALTVHLPSYFSAHFLQTYRSTSVNVVWATAVNKRSFTWHQWRAVCKNKNKKSAVFPTPPVIRQQKCEHLMGSVRRNPIAPWVRLHLSSQQKSSRLGLPCQASPHLILHLPSSPFTSFFFLILLSVSSTFKSSCAQQFCIILLSFDLSYTVRLPRDQSVLIDVVLALNYK